MLREAVVGGRDLCARQWYQFGCFAALRDLRPVRVTMIGPLGRCSLDAPAPIPRLRTPLTFVGQLLAKSIASARTFPLRGTRDTDARLPLSSCVDERGVAPPGPPSPLPPEAAVFSSLSFPNET